MYIRELLGVPSNLRAMDASSFSAKGITHRYRREIRNSNNLRDTYNPNKFPVNRKKQLESEGVFAQIKFFKNQPPVVSYRA